jgi:hypothetical protein
MKSSGYVDTMFAQHSENSITIQTLVKSIDIPVQYEAAFPETHDLAPMVQMASHLAPKGSRNNKFTFLGAEAPVRQGAKALQYQDISIFRNAARHKCIGAYTCDAIFARSLSAELYPQCRRNGCMDDTNECFIAIELPLRLW